MCNKYFSTLQVKSTEHSPLQRLLFAYYSNQVTSMCISNRILRLEKLISLVEKNISSDTNLKQKENCIGNANIVHIFMLLPNKVDMMSACIINNIN